MYFCTDPKESFLIYTKRLCALEAGQHNCNHEAGFMFKALG